MVHFCYLCLVCCHAFLSFHISLVVLCWERAGLLARLYLKCSYVFGTFVCGVLGQVWSLIASIPDICLLTYFNKLNLGMIRQNMSQSSRGLVN